MTKSFLLLGGAVSAFGLYAGVAQAATATATAAASDSSTVNELVVVAEHRTTALQKIPVAVSVFTGAQRDVAGIRSVQDVTAFAPGFSYDPATVHAYIRGVGRQSVNITDDQRVSTYEDEFYVYSPYGLDKSSLFLSQEQIERGPQNVGGRNSAAGSIDEISVRPTDQPYAEIRGEVANFDTYNIEAAASGQVLPGLDLRISGFDHNQDQGYYRNIVPGEPTEGNEIHEWYVEGQADWKPTDKFEWWSRAFAEGWNDRGDAGSRVGFEDGSWDETALTDSNEYVGAGLFINPNFGYAAPGSAGGNPTANAALTAAKALGDPDPIPTAVTLFNPGTLNNPSLNNPNNFASPIQRTVTLNNYDDYNSIMTYHFPGVDLKYTAGIQNYDYTLNYGSTDTDVENYTLPGSSGNAATIGAFNDIMAAVGGSGPFSGCAAGSALCAGGPALPAAKALPSPSSLLITPLINANYIEDDTWTAHDISFQSTTDAPFQWIVGGFFYWQYYNQPYTVTDTSQPQLANPYAVTGAPAAISDPAFKNPLDPTGFVGFTPGTLAASNPTDEIFLAEYRFNVTSEAGYGQFSYKFSDQFKFTGNLRYSYDDKWGSEDYRTIQFANTEIDGFSPYFGAQTPALDVTAALICPTGNNSTATSCFTGPLAKGVTSAAVEQSDGSWMRKLGDTTSALTGGADVDWTPTPDIFAYLRYSRGYESMSFTAGTIAANPEVAPEFLNSYELGYKENFGHHFSFDLAAFYYDYENLQLPISVSVGGVTEAAFINVPKSVSEGIELEGTWNPVHNLVFFGSYSYDYTAILTTCTGTVAGGVLTPASTALCQEDTNDPAAIEPGANPFPGQTTAVKDQGVNGNPLPDAPLNKFAISGAYTWDFDPGSFTFDVNFNYRSAMDGSVFNRAYDNAPGYEDVDLLGTWKGDKDRYEIIGFVKNVANSLQYNVGSGGVGLAGSATSVNSAATGFNEVNIFDLAPPRTFGIELRYKFF